MFVLANIFKVVVRRYLEYVSEFDDPSDGIKNLIKSQKMSVKMTETIRVSISLAPKTNRYLKQLPVGNLISEVCKTKTFEAYCRIKVLQLYQG